MRDALIWSPVRTPVGQMGGALRSVDPETLASLVASAVMGRAELDPSKLDGCIKR